VRNPLSHFEIYADDPEGLGDPFALWQPDAAAK